MEFTLIDDGPSDDHVLPSYSTPGHMLFKVIGRDGFRPKDWEVELIDHGDGAPFWVIEGGFPDYWFNDLFASEIKCPGLYLIKNVIGHYHKGVWGFSDDDVEWETDDPIRIMWWHRLWAWLRRKELQELF